MAMEFLPSHFPFSPPAGVRDGVKEDAEGPEDGENEVLFAEFLESEVLGHDADDPALPEITQGRADSDLSIQTGNFGRVPPELFQNILRFLSSEDLSTCTSVCRFLRGAASDEGLWRRLYCLRWGRPPSSDRPGKPRGCAWKKLYFERDEADMVDFVRNTPAEFREYYIQMQAAKRSQAPLPSQVHDDLVVVDSSMADQITAWRHSQKLADAYLGDHWCSGKTCSYYQIDDVFLCEKTGRVHICDDSCREIVLDPSNELLVCTISGRCFDRWITPAEEDDAEPQQADANAAAEESEPFLGSCRLGRAYLLGYNCADERELDEVVREVLYPSQKKSRFCYNG
ncbi:unnamed protein product [Sphagnum troendelagicum]|uniref:F-box domain-containing protein n=1 Tax=Sphagnum troendelagicum TaxID=128251 RepID=A0ABP0U1R2_9BRYO